MVSLGERATHGEAFMLLGRSRFLQLSSGFKRGGSGFGRPGEAWRMLVCFVSVSGLHLKQEVLCCVVCIISFFSFFFFFLIFFSHPLEAGCSS